MRVHGSLGFAIGFLVLLLGLAFVGFRFFLVEDPGSEALKVEGSKGGGLYSSANVASDPPDRSQELQSISDGVNEMESGGLPASAAIEILRRLDELEERISEIQMARDAAADPEGLPFERQQDHVHEYEEDHLLQLDKQQWVEEFLSAPLDKDGEQWTQRLEDAFYESGVSEEAMIETHCRSSVCRITAHPQEGSQLSGSSVKDWLFQSGISEFSRGAAFMESNGSVTVYLTIE